MPQYQYSRWRPAKHRMMADETPEHKWAYTKRVNVMLTNGSAGHTLFRAECICGWHDLNDEYKKRTIARAKWHGHMREALKQGQLDYGAPVS